MGSNPFLKSFLLYLNLAMVYKKRPIRNFKDKGGKIVVVFCKI